MSFDFEMVSTYLSHMTESSEADLRETMKNVGSKEHASITDTIELQQSLQKWTLALNLESSLIKEMGEGPKAVVQKFS